MAVYMLVCPRSDEAEYARRFFASTGQLWVLDDGVPVPLSKSVVAVLPRHSTAS